MDQCKEQVSAETLTVTILPFTTSEHPFFHKDDVTVKAVCESDMNGFEISEDECMKRVCMSGFKKDGKGSKVVGAATQFVPMRERRGESVARRTSQRLMTKRL